MTLWVVIVNFGLAYGQIPIGAWRDHLSWNTAEIVVVAGKKVYCSNGVGLSIYDTESLNLDKLTKVNGLNDAVITAMQYAPAINAVVVGYLNGNVDIVTQNRVHNIPDIKHSGRYLNKRINDIYLSGNIAYLSCEFGIVVIDVNLRQIRDTYIIGNDGVPAEVFSLTQFNDYFYASTAHGLKKADSKSRLLTDFQLWENVESAPAGIKQVVSTDSYLYVYNDENKLLYYNGFTWNFIPLQSPVEKFRRLSVVGNTVLLSATNAIFVVSNATNHMTIHSSSAAFDATIDNAGTYWIADNKQGLMRWRSANDFSYFLHNGPTSNNVNAMRFKADRLLVAGGDNQTGKIHVFNANQWTTISTPDIYSITDVDVFDKNPNTYYATSWGGGLYVFENEALKTHYTHFNSELNVDISGNIFCGGLLIDDQDRIWISNDKSIVLFSEERWNRLSFETRASFGRLVSDNFGQIWTTQGRNGLFVFNQSALGHELSSNDSVSFKPNNFNNSGRIDVSNQIANTPDGIVWIASTGGPVRYASPERILQREGLAGVHPMRVGNTESNHMFALFGSENILAVAIDGANRKWFATQTSGVFLVDEDNRQTRHFTVDNSPLLSNRVSDIVINDRTGEVFFATSYGIVSYRSDAVSSGDDFGKVYAFPNPVRPGYDGEITITGLIRDADVKITDIAGNLVYHTRSLGGMAVWSGRNRQGRLVASGVYLLFCTNMNNNSVCWKR